MFKLKKLRRFLPYLLVVLVSGFVLARNVNKPFYGHHDWNGVFYGNIARNYQRYGFLKTKLGQVTSIDFQSVDKFNYYTHYPPLFPIILAVSYWIFGVSEATARLVPILFTTASMVLIYHLGRKLKFSTLSAIASLVVVFTPMVRYFGKMPSQEAPMIFLTLFSVIYYLDFINQPKSKNLSKLLLVTFFNGLTGWAGYFIYPILTIHSFIFHRHLWKQIARPIIVLIFTFILHLIHTYILTGSLFGGNLFGALLLRMNLLKVFGQIDPTEKVFTWLGYIKQEAHWLVVYYTRILLLITSLFLLVFGYKVIKKIRLSQSESIIFSLFLFGISYLLVFPNVAFIHEYFSIFLVPFLGLSFSWVINRLYDQCHLSTMILTLLLVSLIIRERLPFYQSLEETRAHQIGYYLGNVINEQTSPQESALIFSKDNYMSGNDVFIKYYGDRNIDYFPYDNQGWQEANQKLLSQVDHVFTVPTDLGDSLFIDDYLSTQSAMVNYDDFNYYILERI